MGPGKFITDPISAISFGMALMFGTAGLPHILMRFFTVPNAKEARKSVLWATTWIGYFYMLTFIIGFGAITFVLTNPQFLDGKGALLGGSNMAAIHLANAVGGNVFLGFISAVAFATILAVVAGLTLSGASAVSHDLYATVIKGGKADPTLLNFVGDAQKEGRWLGAYGLYNAGAAYRADRDSMVLTHAVSAGSRRLSVTALRWHEFRNVSAATPALAQEGDAAPVAADFVQGAEIHLDQHGDDHHPDEQADGQIHLRHLQATDGPEQPGGELAGDDAGDDAQAHPHAQIALEDAHRCTGRGLGTHFTLND